MCRRVGSCVSFPRVFHFTDLHRFVQSSFLWLSVCIAWRRPVRTPTACAYFHQLLRTAIGSTVALSSSAESEAGRAAAIEFYGRNQIRVHVTPIIRVVLQEVPYSLQLLYLVFLERLLTGYVIKQLAQLMITFTIALSSKHWLLGSFTKQWVGPTILNIFIHIL